MSTLTELDITPAPPLAVGYEEEDDIAKTEVANIRSEFTYDDSKRLLRKADWRLLPLLIAMYLCKNMDGNLVSYVKTMNTGESGNILKSLNITANQFAFAQTCFSVTYIVFEVPSNLIIKWASPRLHFFRILVLWSVVCACTAACTNLAGFLTARAFLGLAEAGLLPGIYWQLTCWYRPDEIALRMASLSVLGQFSGIIDSLFTYGLSYIDGRGLEGWRWAYLICGLIGLLLSVWLFFFFPDFPDSPSSRRQFLTQEEGKFLVARLPPNAARSTDANFDWQAIKRELKSPLLWGFSFFALCMNSSLYGLAFWLPTIINSFGLTKGPKSQLLNIPSAVISIISSLSLSWILDNDTKIPRPIFMLSGATGLIGVFLGMIFCKSSGGLYALILLAQLFASLMTCALLPLRSQSLRGATSAAFIMAFQNAWGQIPGLYTAQFFQTKYAPRYAVSYSISIVFVIALMISVLFIWYFQFNLEKQTREIARLRRKEGKKNIVVEEDVSL
ncbi:uncharacterized protein I206_105927 [Kwoniella pini CBS 10737]|uniref:Major facilitator superfamily (MFS) profile domain-containing protein n=1 Tax=Kwoniella pini CBS 10737 TaxID=1296096 RepID=A0A1B9I0J6_9TREE|nr:uncharacterized protein I206_04750 [Kwoniella pini CBS 10737]OCF49063.1 hypothetical protein I206_04750 [Kwoniella pini CBS 10737]